MSAIEELLPLKVYSLKNLVSSEECQKQIDLAEGKGFRQATINNVAKEDIRNNETVIRDDSELAGELWDRIRPHLPTEFLSEFSEEDGTQALGLSDHFRTYRYDKGQKFVRHYDGYEYGSMVYSKDTNKPAAPQAKISVIVFLNEAYEGGNTTFFNAKGKEILAVKGETGMVLVYTHRLLNEGSVVTDGRKYVLRTDIMFGQPSAEEPKPQGWGSTCSIQ
eukprot:TRINITY_DN6806_c0_g2_i1.p1 TRINITY_DN6806_c0_g2~~TRINITY_DN6806_c0_g2_i1.p1  ORF type:complete len:235 (-),score=36.70 TRINITY_DN6806_c0_g2_i1:38-697(-)